jgi:hypothetical protein
MNKILTAKDLLEYKDILSERMAEILSEVENPEKIIIFRDSPESTIAFREYSDEFINSLTEKNVVTIQDALHGIGEIGSAKYMCSGCSQRFYSFDDQLNHEKTCRIKILKEWQQGAEKFYKIIESVKSSTKPSTWTCAFKEIRKNVPRWLLTVGVLLGCYLVIFYTIHCLVIIIGYLFK